MIQLPPKNQWVQTNRSDVLGSLLGSFNLDLTKVYGNTRTSRMIQTTTQVTNTDLNNYPVGFKMFEGKIWTVAGSKLHNTSTAVTNAAFTVDATAFSPTTLSSVYSDIELFNNNLYVTGNNAGGDKLYELTPGGNWDSGNATTLGTLNGPHMMCVFNNRLYMTVTNSYKVYSMDTSNTIATSSSNTLTFTDTANKLTFMRPAYNRIWLGTVNTQGGKAYIYEWDGATPTNPTRSYRLESGGALAGVVKDDNLWFMDTNGRLMTYSGGTFIEKARLPLNNKYLTNITNNANNRFIHPNGMTLVDGKINILINNQLNDNAGSIMEFCPSGIWEYDENIGLYHKNSLSYTPSGTNTITDYGQTKVYGVGGLSEMKLLNTISDAGGNGNLLAGAVIYTNGSSTNAGIFTNDTLDAVTGTYKQTQRSAYLVTTKLTSSQVSEKWQKVWVRFKQMLSSTNKIVVKSRSTDPDPTYIDITWVDDQTFTTTTNVLGLEGYEVEVLQGTGAGYMAHISSIDNNNTYYTVHLDDTFEGVTTGTAKARIQNWEKRATFQNDQVSQYSPFPIEDSSHWLEIKVHFLFTANDEMDDMLVIHKPNQLAN